jgi:hypothetical protein
MAEAAAPRLRHPNQEKASSQATKLVVTILLIVSSVLIFIVLVGGWTAQQGARPLTLMHAVVYAIMAYYVFQWKRGVLVLAGALSLLFAIYVATGLPFWFERTKAGYAETIIPAEIIGLLMVVILIVQTLTVVASMVGFNQEWNLEIEERSDQDEDYEDHEDDSYGDHDDDDGHDDRHDQTEEHEAGQDVQHQQR